jgi:hypothetical protein
VTPNRPGHLLFQEHPLCFAIWVSLDERRGEVGVQVEGLAANPQADVEHPGPLEDQRLVELFRGRQGDENLVQHLGLPARAVFLVHGVFTSQGSFRFW